MDKKGVGTKLSVGY